MRVRFSSSVPSLDQTTISSLGLEGKGERVVRVCIMVFMNVNGYCSCYNECGDLSEDCEAVGMKNHRGPRWKLYDIKHACSTLQMNVQVGAVLMPLGMFCFTHLSKFNVGMASDTCS